MGCLFTKKKKLQPPPSRNITLKQIIAWEEFCKEPQNTPIVNRLSKINQFNRNIKSSPINITYPLHLKRDTQKCVGVLIPNIPIPLFGSVNAFHIDN
jgi:hypothetical protein